MADSSSLKVMYLFEAGSRLRCSAEVVGLAAHLYHKFFRQQQDMNQFDLYTFGSACLNLARHFYETKCDSSASSEYRHKLADCLDIAVVMISVVHGPEQILDVTHENNLALSINYASQIIAINLNFQIDYKDTRRMTPGDILRTTKSIPEQYDDNFVAQESSDDEYYNRDEAEKALSRNCKHTISSHRYLAHYLKCIKLLIHPESELYFRKIANVAWIILSDYHWSSSVTRHYSHHLACASLMMAIETCRKELDSTMSAKAVLWDLVNKKWNLIFCDDFNNQKLEQTIYTIVNQYSEYDRLMKHEFSTYVIDPQGTKQGVPL